MHEKTGKRFIALARVSTREQEQEGWSLETQEEAFHRYAADKGGTIVKLWKIAETATRYQQRRSFKEMLAYARAHAADLDGLLFYKFNRATRNIYDYVELERLESEHGLPFISLTERTENTPAGRMHRRMLANMASFFSEQLSVDVRVGRERRVQAGLFPGPVPFGYRNVRSAGGRRLVEVDPGNAAKVKRIFQLYAYERVTIEGLIDRLAAEGILYRRSTPRFNRTSLHHFLRDRSYLGEIRFQGQWHPGTHEPLVDRVTWERAQAILGDRVMHPQELVYAGSLIRCGHCGYFITGQCRRKQTKAGTAHYRYYFCSQRARPGHPHVNVKEEELDRQMLDHCQLLRIEDDAVLGWFHAALRAVTEDGQQALREQRAELERQRSVTAQQQDRLLNLRLDGEIDPATYAAKATELRDRAAILTVKIEALDRSRQDDLALAAATIELAQTLSDRLLEADFAAKRNFLEIFGSNYRLNDGTLYVERRKPFDILAEGPVLNLSGRRGSRTLKGLGPRPPSKRVPSPVGLPFRVASGRPRGTRRAALCRRRGHEVDADSCGKVHAASRIGFSR